MARVAEQNDHCRAGEQKRFEAEHVHQFGPAMLCNRIGNANPLGRHFW
jgi:hypothetical protein